MMKDFKNSKNNGFIISGFPGNQLVTLRLKNNLWKLKLDKNDKLIPVDYEYPKDYNIKELKKVSVIISTVLKDYRYLIED
jgi:hypothetical protein